MGYLTYLQNGVYWGYNDITHWSQPFRYWLFGTSKSYNLLLKKCLKIRHPHQKEKCNLFFPEALYFVLEKNKISDSSDPLFFPEAHPFLLEKNNHILIFYSVSWFSEDVGWCRPKVWKRSWKLVSEKNPLARCNWCPESSGVAFLFLFVFSANS